MKEVDRMKILVSSLREWWVEAGNPRVQTVHLLVGALSGVDTKLLSRAFEAQKVATFLDQANLVIEDIPFLAFCRNCQQEYQPEIGQRYCCPICTHPLHEVRSGRELKIGDIKYSSQKARGTSRT
jgi:hydrogenase nickel incorporation protein HypA/HybF